MYICLLRGLCSILLNICLKFWRWYFYLKNILLLLGLFYVNVHKSNISNFIFNKVHLLHFRLVRILYRCYANFLLLTIMFHFRSNTGIITVSALITVKSIPYHFLAQKHLLPHLTKKECLHWWLSHYQMVNWLRRKILIWWVEWWRWWWQCWWSWRGKHWITGGQWMIVIFHEIIQLRSRQITNFIFLLKIYKMRMNLENEMEIRNRIVALKERWSM